MSVKVLLWCFVCHLVLSAVSGQSISLSSQEIGLGAQQPSTTTARCTITEVSNIFAFNSLQLSHVASSGGTPQIVLSIYNSPAGGNNPNTVFYGDDVSSDLQGRTTMNGNLDSNDYSQSYLELSFTTNSMMCRDEGQYTCTFNYAFQGQTAIQETRSANLSTIAMPLAPVIQVQVGSQNGPVVTDSTTLNVGDMLYLSCAADLGSYETETVTWERTSQLPQATDENFNQYSPSAADSSPGNVGNKVDCRYSRTATMTYNVTDEDSTRNNRLGFRCFTQVSAPVGSGLSSAAVNSENVYINVASSGNGGSGSPGGSTDTTASNAGAIAGGVVAAVVVIVLVILLVYFLWYRRRGGAGETYKTREDQGSENPNMANSEMYATVDKDRKRRGHENKGLDEDHSGPNYRNADDVNGTRHGHGGKRNYAMEREVDDSRDGSPTMMHMSGGQLGTGV